MKPPQSRPPADNRRPLPTRPPATPMPYRNLALASCLLASTAAAHPQHEQPQHAHPQQDQPRHDQRQPTRRDDLPPPSVSITVVDGYRVIESNGIPDHDTGSFPGPNNPNAITAQRHRFRVPVEPTRSDKLIPVTLGKFGVALNGLPFDPGAAEFYDGFGGRWQYEAKDGVIDLGLDHHHAHVQPQGSYHYHGLPRALVESLGGDDDRMRLIGYAADGYPIYSDRVHEVADDPSSPLVRIGSSYRVKSGDRPAGDGDPGGYHDGTFGADYEYVATPGGLDEANGRTGVTPEHPGGTYYYVLTDDYPFIPRHFRGRPDPSFRGPGFRNRNFRGPGGPPADRRSTTGPTGRHAGPRRGSFCRPNGRRHATREDHRPGGPHRIAGGPPHPFGHPPGHPSDHPPPPPTARDGSGPAHPDHPPHAPTDRSPNDRDTFATAPPHSNRGPARHCRGGRRNRRPIQIADTAATTP